MNLRILHVIASLAARNGGPTKACLEMAQAVSDLGHEVFVFCTDANMEEHDFEVVESYRKNGIEVLVFPVGRPRTFFTSWPLYRALGTAIQECSVVHVHSLYHFHCWAVSRQCTKHGVPYIIRPHGMLDPVIYHRKRLRKAVVEILYQNRVTRNAAGIHLTANEEANLARPHLFGRREYIIPNGLNIYDYRSLPKDGEFRKRHPKLGGDPFFLFLGRLNFKKGLDILSYSFPEVLKRHPEMRLVIAGPADPGIKEQTEKTLQALGAMERTIFVGPLYGDDKLAAFNDAELFVLPSYSENFGIAVVEALVCGLPVLITDKVNIWREIADANVGRVSEPNVSAFAKIMTEAVEDRTWRNSVSTRGPEFVASHYNWETIAGNLEGMYCDTAQRASHDKIR